MGCPPRSRQWRDGSEGCSVSRVSKQCRSRARAGRWDVLVEPEEVGGVVLRFDRAQPIPRRARVCLAHPLLALITEKVDIGRGLAVPQRRGEAPPPLFLLGGPAPLAGEGRGRSP